jgi:hypothetical protein
MSQHELIKSVLKRKYWILSIFIVAAVCATYYEWRTPYQYKSSVKFFIEEEELYSTELNVLKSASQNRIFYFIKSTEMFDFLIDKFDLYKGYGIDTATLQHYEVVNSILNDRVEVKTDNRNAIIVTVKDMDKYRAAAIANEIYNKVSEMNKEFAISVALKKIKVYEQIISSSKAQLTDQVKEFNNLVESTKKLLAENQFKKNETFVMDIRNTLTGFSNRLSGINDDLLKTVKIYEVSKAATEKENIISLRLINVALPDISSPVQISVFSIAIWSFAAAFFTILSIVIYKEYQAPLSLILNRTLPD